jgi:hypothetical protein
MEDLICKSLDMLKISIDKEDIELFEYAVSRDGMPNEFTFESTQGYFKVNVNKKEFRILKRNHYGELVLLGYPTDAEIDKEIAFIWKLACRSGYKVYLENKYSN